MVIKWGKESEKSAKSMCERTARYMVLTRKKRKVTMKRKKIDEMLLKDNISEKEWGSW